MKTKTDPTQEYILKSKRNLHIAGAVAVAWSEVRAKIAAEFIDRLETRLKTQLKGWEYGREANIYVAEYPTNYFWKPGWTDNYGFCLQWGRYGEEMVFGVYREKEKVGKRRFSKELFDAVAKIQPSVKTNPWYEARIKIKHPAPDWRSPEVLWRMRQEDEFLTDVADQLLEIVKVSEGIIDDLVRDYSKKTAGS